MVSECGTYQITNSGKKGGNKYVLREKMNLDVRIATGKKRKPFEQMNIEFYGRILRIGNLKEVRLHASIADQN